MNVVLDDVIGSLQLCEAWTELRSRTCTTLDKHTEVLGCTDPPCKQWLDLVLGGDSSSSAVC